jgi:hypothetical protein
LAGDSKDYDIAEKFNRELLRRLPNTEFAEKILAQVHEIYEKELQERIDFHAAEAWALEQSRHELEALTHSLLVELYKTLLEKARV